MKFGARDRYDSLIIRNNQSIFEDPWVSKEADRFSMSSGVISSMFTSNSRKSIYFGINKREDKVSGSGWNVSKVYIGQGDT